MQNLILASTSVIRSALLTRAGIAHQIRPARVDEDAARGALLAEGARHRDIADALAEMKARKIAEKQPADLVLGCDQVLSFQGNLMAKPRDPADAMAQLAMLQNNTHSLFSAIVLYENARPVWRHIAECRMSMRKLSTEYLTSYVARNWQDIRHSVGCYLIESEGITLFSAIDAEQTAIQGLPLPPFLGYLGLRGLIAS